MAEVAELSIRTAVEGEVLARVYTVDSKVLSETEGSRLRHCRYHEHLFGCIYDILCLLHCLSPSLYHCLPIFGGLPTIHPWLPQFLYFACTFAYMSVVIPVQGICQADCTRAK